MIYSLSVTTNNQTNSNGSYDVLKLSFKRAHGCYTFCDIIYKHIEFHERNQLLLFLVETHFKLFSFPFLSLKMFGLKGLL